MVDFSERYELVCCECDDRMSISKGSRDFKEYEEYKHSKSAKNGFGWYRWCGNCQRETKQKIERFSILPKKKKRTKETITEFLKDLDLKTSDLSSEFQDWEVKLSKLDDVGKIQEFQQQILQEINSVKLKNINRSRNMLFGMLFIILMIVFFLVFLVPKIRYKNPNK